MDNSSHETMFLCLSQAHSAPGSGIYTPRVDSLSSQTKCDQSKGISTLGFIRLRDPESSLRLCSCSYRTQGTQWILCLSQIPVFWAQSCPRASVLGFQALDSKMPASFLLPIYWPPATTIEISTAICPRWTFTAKDTSFSEALGLHIITSGIYITTS